MNGMAFLDSSMPYQLRRPPANSTVMVPAVFIVMISGPVRFVQINHSFPGFRKTRVVMKKPISTKKPERKGKELYLYLSKKDGLFPGNPAGGLLWIDWVIGNQYLWWGKLELYPAQKLLRKEGCQTKVRNTLKTWKKPGVFICNKMPALPHWFVILPISRERKKPGGPQFTFFF